MASPDPQRLTESATSNIDRFHSFPTADLHEDWRRLDERLEALLAEIQSLSVNDPACHAALVKAEEMEGVLADVQTDRDNRTG
jgi:hypothetical protein